MYDTLYVLIFGHLLSLIWIIRKVASLHICFTPPLKIDHFCCPDAPVYSYVLHQKMDKITQYRVYLQFKVARRAWTTPKTAGLSITKTAIFEKKIEYAL